MGQAAHKWVTSVQFWDSYAKWYKLWIEHTRYHAKIEDILMKMARPGWKVLDIGAGNGILSLPLCRRGCQVTALEPSMGMRSLLYEEVDKIGMGRLLNVDHRRWEAVSYDEFLDCDLILACNSLHLTRMGFGMALAKIFRVGPRNVFLITEIEPPEIPVKWSRGDYATVFTQSYEVDNSFAYHHLNEMLEHWTFIKGRVPQPDEVRDLKEKVVLRDRHLWIRHTSRILMYWWSRKEVKHFTWNSCEDGT